MKKKCKTTTKKYKMMNVSAEQLKKNIKEVIVPISDNVHGKNIDRDFFFNYVSIRKPKSQLHLINLRKDGLNLNETELFQNS